MATTRQTTTKAAPKVPAPKKILPSNKEVKAAPKKATLPVNELNTWLGKHHHWNHNDWLNLLADLEKNGHSEFVSTEEGRHEIGRYLEKHRH